MIELTDRIKNYEENIVRERIEVIPQLCHGDVEYKGKLLPKGLSTKFLKRTGTTYTNADSFETVVREYLTEKELVLHGLKKEDQIKWYALTSDKFKPIRPQQIFDALEKVADQKPTVRQYRDNYSVDFNFPIECELPGIYGTIEMGQYGLLGGNGESALRYGLSWFNDMCTNWTLFLPEDIEFNKRVIHMNSEEFSTEDLSNRLKGLFKFKDVVVDAIEDSKDIVVEKDTLESYLSLYANRRGLNKKIVNKIVEETPTESSLYDLAFNMTLFCQNMTRTDMSRKRVEYLAGELLLSYDKILEKVQEEQQKVLEIPN